MAFTFVSKKGTTAANDAHTGVKGEITIDTEQWVIRLHDGETQGGFVVGSASVDLCNSVEQYLNEVDVKPPAPPFFRRNGRVVTDKAGFVFPWGWGCSSPLTSYDPLLDHDIVSVKGATGRAPYIIKKNGELRALYQVKQWSLANEELKAIDRTAMYPVEAIPSEAMYNIVDVTNNRYFSVALKRTGELVFWTSRYFYTPNQMIPDFVKNTKFVAIEGSSDFICALTQHGEVFIWNISGAFHEGNDPVAERFDCLPVPMEGREGVIDMVLCRWVYERDNVRDFKSEKSVLALKADQTLVAWGIETGSVWPIPEDIRTNIVMISGTINAGSPAALRSNGQIVTFPNSFKCSINTPKDIVSIAKGEDYILALRESGEAVLIAEWHDDASYDVHKNFPTLAKSGVIGVASGQNTCYIIKEA